MVTIVQLNKLWLSGSIDCKKKKKMDRSALNVTDRFVQLPCKFILEGPLVSRVTRELDPNHNRLRNHSTSLPGYQLR